MRTALITANLLALAQIAMAQTSPSSVSTDALTIRASAEGICYFLDRSTPCVDVGHYLSSKHLAQNGHVDIVVDRALNYEIIEATLRSLQNAGFTKIGFVNKDFQ
jgi:biopolymer transport protein ExbD